MAVTENVSAPYAPASAVMEIINRYRSKGLPTPITGEVLSRAGISESLTPRTLQALETLDLIDEKGVPTPILIGLQKAPEPEFKQRLAEWLNTAYADVLLFIDPATADETAIRDAFRSYKPVGQQSRMVTLFQGLYAAAGVIADKRPPTSRPTTRTATSLRPRQNGTPQPEQKKQVFIGGGGAGTPPALAGLIASIPFARGGWSQAEREKFMAAFGGVLDYCMPIVERQTTDEPENDT
jgi:hypothetical protein